MISDFLDSYWHFMLGHFSIFGTFIGLALLALGAILALVLALAILSLPFVIYNVIAEIRMDKKRKALRREIAMFRDKGNTKAMLAAAKQLAEIADDDDNFFLGSVYYDADESKHDPKKAAHYLRKAAKNGHAAAQAKLLKIMLLHDLEAESKTEILDYLKNVKAAGGKENEMFLALAEKYSHDLAAHGLKYEGSGDSVKAFEACSRAAQWGFPPSQYSLGLLYEYGKGTEKNLDEALFWHREAALQGFAPSQVRAGRLYVVKDDYSSAAEMFSKAIEKGEAEAYYSLGMLYISGKGVEKDADKGISLLETAAEKGFVAAYLQISIAYLLKFVQTRPRDYNLLGHARINLYKARDNDPKVTDEVFNKTLADIEAVSK